MYSNNQSDPPRSSNDKDVPHEHTRRKKTQKYLRKNCYHRIKYTATTFLAAFMWRRPLNSAVMTTTIHRKPEKVSNGIGTQVSAQLINKCRMKMIQRELYNVRDPPWERDWKNRERENIVATKMVFVSNCDQFIQVWPPWIESPLTSDLLFVFDCHLIQY